MAGNNLLPFARLGIGVQAFGSLFPSLLCSFFTVCLTFWKWLMIMEVAAVRSSYRGSRKLASDLGLYPFCIFVSPSSSRARIEKMSLRQRGRLGILGGVALFVMLPSLAQGALIQFSNRADFLAQTGATAATSIPIDSEGPKGGSYTSGSLTFTAFTAFGGSFSVHDWSARLPGRELGIGGSENFDVDVNSGIVYSFGFDFVEPQFDPNLGGTFVDSTFSVTLLNGATPIGSFTFNRPNDSAEFVGVWTGPGEGFNRVQVRETIGSFENEFFGQFYTGTSPIAAVPEPSSLLLACVALAGGTALSRIRRRRRLAV